MGGVPRLAGAAMTTSANLAFSAGETTTYVFPVIDGDGDPVDVDGWTGIAQVREYPMAPIVRHEWSADNDNISVAGTSVTLTTTATDTAAWAWSKGVYHLEVTDTSGNVHRVAQGNVAVSREVTR
jgi:hypothetical protein